MRIPFAIGSVIVLSLLAACSDEDRPNDVPRTVPPASSDGTAATAPAIKGVGPTIEVIAYAFAMG